MQRYTDTLAALNTAMALMEEEGDSLLVAAISHALHMAESQAMLHRAQYQSRFPADYPSARHASRE